MKELFFLKKTPSQHLNVLKNKHLNQSIYRCQNLEMLQMLDLYLENLRRLNKSEYTILNYKMDLLKFFYWLENGPKIPLSKVTGDSISQYKEFLQSGGSFHRSHTPSNGLIPWIKKIIPNIRKKSEGKPLIQLASNEIEQVPGPSFVNSNPIQAPLSVGSRRRHLSGLKNFFQFLKEVHEDKGQNFKLNPVKTKIHAIKLKDSDVDNTKMLKAEDFQTAFEKSFRTKDKLILLLLYDGGLRLSELTHLKVADFDRESLTVTIIRKGGKKQRLAMTNARKIFRHLDYYLAQTRPTSAYLFANKKGEPFSSRAIYNLIMKILNRAGVASIYTPHSFRKACATMLYRKSQDLLLVRDYLGHSDAKVTQTYIETQNHAELEK